MSERETATKTDVSVTFWLLWLLIMLTLWVNHQQANALSDLQRRVGQLESAAKKQ